MAFPGVAEPVDRAADPEVVAVRAQLSLASTSELVTELERLGCLERRPDPADGRATLIHPTARGRRALDGAGDRVAEIEQHWGELVGPEEFAQACRVLARLLAQLTTAEAPTAPGAPQ